MKEDFLITINSTQEVASQSDQISLTAVGSYNFTEDLKIIRFYEYDEEEADQVSLSTLTIDKDNKIVLTKEGSVNTQLLLQKGERHMCHYITEFGPLQVGTFTENVKIDLDENGGSVFAAYSIDINSSVTSKNTVDIKIQKAGNE